MKNLMMYLLALVLIVIPGIELPHAEEVQVDGKALFEKTCSLCHSIERPKSKKKTAKEWEGTVMRMKNVNGAPVTDEEVKIVIEYLTENYGTK